MKALITAATEIELSALPELPPSITKMVTGVGIMETTYHLTKILDREKYDLIVNIGLCGSLSDKIEIGSVVQVTHETVADLGAEDANTFIDIFDLYLKDANVFPYEKKWMRNSIILPEIREAKGITVNRVTGSETSVQAVKERWDADIETMEAAAVFYVCLMEKQHFYCLRAVSNKVEKRNREQWQPGLALDTLRKTMKGLIKSWAED